MIISFGYTSAALLAGAKTVTRRDWKTHHAAQFWPSQLVDAYDKSPRNGGRKVGVVRIVSKTRESIVCMPDSDFRAEGFHWLHEQGIRPPKSSGFTDFGWGDFVRWRASGAVLYVVRFELVAVVDCRK